MGISLLIALATLLTACATPTPEVVTVVETKEVEVVNEVEVTKEVEVEVLVTPTAMPEKHAKYIFLFIGDGMGVAQRNAAELYLAATANADARPEETRLLQFRGIGIPMCASQSPLIFTVMRPGKNMNTGVSALKSASSP